MSRLCAGVCLCRLEPCICEDELFSKIGLESGSLSGALPCYTRNELRWSGAARISRCQETELLNHGALFFESATNLLTCVGLKHLLRWHTDSRARACPTGPSCPRRMCHYTRSVALIAFLIFSSSFDHFDVNFECVHQRIQQTDVSSRLLSSPL